METREVIIETALDELMLPNTQPAFAAVAKVYDAGAESKAEEIATLRSDLIRAENEAIDPQAQIYAEDAPAAWQQIEHLHRELGATNAALDEANDALTVERGRGDHFQAVAEELRGEVDRLLGELKADRSALKEFQARLDGAKAANERLKQRLATREASGTISGDEAERLQHKRSMLGGHLAAARERIAALESKLYWAESVLECVDADYNIIGADEMTPANRQISREGTLQDVTDYLAARDAEDIDEGDEPELAGDGPAPEFMAAPAADATSEEMREKIDQARRMLTGQRTEIRQLRAEIEQGEQIRDSMDAQLVKAGARIIELQAARDSAKYDADAYFAEWQLTDGLLATAKAQLERQRADWEHTRTRGKAENLRLLEMNSGLRVEIRELKETNQNLRALLEKQPTPLGAGDLTREGLLAYFDQMAYDGDGGARFVHTTSAWLADIGMLIAHEAAQTARAQADEHANRLGDELAQAGEVENEKAVLGAEYIAAPAADAISEEMRETIAQARRQLTTAEWLADVGMLIAHEAAKTATTRAEGAEALNRELQENLRRANELNDGQNNTLRDMRRSYDTTFDRLTAERNAARDQVKMLQAENPNRAAIIAALDEFENILVVMDNREGWAALHAAREALAEMPQRPTDHERAEQFANQLGDANQEIERLQDEIVNEMRKVADLRDTLREVDACVQKADSNLRLQRPMETRHGDAELYQLEQARHAIAVALADAPATVVEFPTATEPAGTVAQVLPVTDEMLKDAEAMAQPTNPTCGCCGRSEQPIVHSVEPPFLDHPLTWCKDCASQKDEDVEAVLKNQADHEGKAAEPEAPAILRPREQPPKCPRCHFHHEHATDCPAGRNA